MNFEKFIVICSQINSTPFMRIKYYRSFLAFACASQASAQNATRSVFIPVPKMMLWCLSWLSN